MHGRQHQVVTLAPIGFFLIRGRCLRTLPLELPVVSPYVVNNAERRTKTDYKLNKIRKNI